VRVKTEIPNKSKYLNSKFRFEIVMLRSLAILPVIARSDSDVAISLYVLSF